MHHVTFYGLSTCGWCKRTKRFLDANDVDHKLIYVDLLRGVERERIIAEIRQWNPQVSFPTVVVDDQTVQVSHLQGLPRPLRALRIGLLVQRRNVM